LSALSSAAILSNGSGLLEHLAKATATTSGGNPAKA